MHCNVNGSWSVFLFFPSPKLVCTLLQLDTDVHSVVIPKTSTSLWQ